MKATGIVRRIDDLGRVVIPKEIRRTLRIREGDPLEIFTDREGEIILKKYSPIGELSTLAQQLCDSISQTLNKTTCICDSDLFIAAAGSEKKHFLDQKVHEELSSFIDQRQCTFLSQKEEFFPLIDREDEPEHPFVAATIICEGDAIGCILILNATENDLTIAKSSALLLGHHMES